MISVGIVGYGYWGPNLVRNFHESDECRVVSVSDVNADRLALVNKRYPGVEVTTDGAAQVRDPRLDVIVIATPVATHAELALAAIEAGKHVLVSKPLTNSVATARQLVEAAERCQRVLLVDHTFVYTGAVRKIHDLIASGGLGTLLYYNSTRVNLGLIQNDVDVLWDLAVHDLSILDLIVDERPIAVSATGMKHQSNNLENIAYLSLYYPSQMIAHMHVSWLAPVKVRQILIGGSSKMIVYDDIEASEKVKVYDRGVILNGNPHERHKMLVSYRVGDMYAPLLDNTESLKVEVAHFLACIRGEARPRTGGLAGLRIVQILDAASRSLAMRGAPVELQLP